MAVTKSCLNCGRRYNINAPASTHFDVDYCSIECFKEDEAKLAEGNEAILAATKNEALTDLNKLRMDTQGPIGQALGGLNLVKFGTQQPLIQPVKENEND